MILYQQCSTALYQHCINIVSTNIASAGMVDGIKLKLSACFDGDIDENKRSSAHTDTSLLQQLLLRKVRLLM